jgi:hypothetical protein
MAIAIELQSDEKNIKVFYKLASKKLPKSSGTELRKNLTASLICYITRAKSENQVKQVWKQSRALDYLVYDQGVKPEHVAIEIKQRGGIEAIAKVAAKEKPRRKRQKTIAKGVSNPTIKQQLAKPSPQVQSEPTESDDWEPIKPAVEKDQGDDITTILLHVSRALKAEIEAISSGRRVKLICTRGDRGTSSAVAGVIDKVRRLEE